MSCIVKGKDRFAVYFRHGADNWRLVVRETHKEAVFEYEDEDGMGQVAWNDETGEMEPSEQAEVLVLALKAIVAELP
jgi:hypothetical protein